MATLPVLVLNSGSSSIKFSFYEAAGEERKKLLEGEVDRIGDSAKFWIKSWLNGLDGLDGLDGADGAKLIDETPQITDLDAAFTLISKALTRQPFPRPAAIGHRMVCGGPTVIENQRITPELIEEMERSTDFAPLHTPNEIYIMRQAMQLFPDVPNFVCLDSWFHRDLPEVTRYLPIPAEYAAMGLRRFGAHGLSYESIVAHLQREDGACMPSRLIVAHLGNGASICAIRDGKSVDTSMGLTPTGGLISGSRTGDIDPGVLLFLLRNVGEKTKDASEAADQLEKIVNKQSGLLGLSKHTNDMRALRKAIAEGNAAARLAVDEFTYAIRKYIGSYMAVLGGLDMLVFTGGIGENDAATRAEACAGLESLGILLDAELNRARGEAKISASGSPVAVRVIPAEENLAMVNHVRRLLDENAKLTRAPARRSAYFTMDVRARTRICMASVRMEASSTEFMASHSGECCSASVFRSAQSINSRVTPAHRKNAHRIFESRGCWRSCAEISANPLRNRRSVIRGEGIGIGAKPCEDFLEFADCAAASTFGTATDRPAESQQALSEAIAAFAVPSPAACSDIRSSYAIL